MKKQNVLKQTISIFLVFVMIILMIPFSALPAAAANYSGACGENGDNLAWSLNTSTGVLTISGTGNMMEYDSYTSVPWYGDRYEITSVVIKEGVTSIGAYAFWECTSLTSVSIPEGVTRIGNRAFGYSYRLESISIPESVTYIGTYAFCCSGLASITLPKGVTHIDGSAFFYSSLRKIIVPNTVTTIGYDIFSGCGSVTLVYCGTESEWKSISKDSRWDWSADYSFQYHEYDTTGIVTTSPTHMTEGVRTFACACGATRTESIETLMAHEWDEGVINGDNIKVYTCPCGDTKTDQDVYSGNFNGLAWTMDRTTGVLTISGTGEMADQSEYDRIPWYEHRDYIKTLIIGEGITGIGAYWFGDCENLTSATIADSVAAIDQYAFTNCPSLTQTENGVSYIDRWAIDGDSSLSSIVVRQGTVGIRDYAFYYCTTATDIVIPNSVRSIGTSAYVRTVKVTYCGTVTQWKNLKKYGLPSQFHDYADGVCTICESVCDGSNTMSGVHGDNLTWTLNFDTGLLIISGIGYMEYCEDNNDFPWYDYSSYINTVIIEEGVTSIAAYAFESYGELSSVTLPSSLKNIYSWAFAYCYKLTSIKIPNGVTSIGYFSFYNCSRLTSVVIPNSVTTIDISPFQSCNALTKIVYCGTISQWQAIKRNSTDLGGSAMPQLHNYVGDTCVECGHVYDDSDILRGEINQNYYTWSLDFSTGELKISGLGSMPNYDSASPYLSPWYSYRSFIKTATISKDVTTIGQHAFYNCTQLTNVTFEAGCKLICVDYAAFKGCTKLTEITIPTDTTYYIDRYAFYGCTSLTNITLPEGLTSIGDYAFYKCSNLTDITIPKGVISIGAYAFYDCLNLENVTIQEGLVRIGECGFASCDKLKKVSLPNSITNIEKWGLSSNESLETIVYCGTLSEWEAVTKVNYWDSNVPGTVQLHDYKDGKCAACGIEKISDDVISGTSTYINWSLNFNTNTLTLANKYAYSYPTGSFGDGKAPWYNYRLYIKSIVIEEGINAIDSGVFYNCYKAASITIPNSVLSVNRYAFTGCSQLIEIENGIHYVANWAIDTDSGISSIKIREGTVGIGKDAFYGGNLSLSSVTIPEGVRVLSDSAFGNWYNLTSITIPSSVEYIGSSAFSSCSKLSKVSFAPGSKLKMIGNSAFSLTNLQTVIFCAPKTQWESALSSNSLGYGIYPTIRCHDISLGEITKEPTHTEEGIKTYVCDLCGAVETETLETVGDHEWDDGVVTTEPTHTTEGVKKFTCECGSTYTEKIAALGHDHKATITAPKCTEAGYTTYTCDCGDSYISDEVDALGHDYTAQGDCSVCGEYRATFSGASLTLEDNIAVNFKVAPEQFEGTGYTNPYVVFTFNGEQYTVTEYTFDTKGRYAFAFTDIAPRMMNDVIVATLYATYEGEQVVCQTRSYSVKEYCYNMLSRCNEGGVYANNEKFKTLLVDLLNYGEAAQIYGNYKVDTLVTADLTDTQKSWATDTTPTVSTVHNLRYKTIKNPAVGWQAGGLLLEDAVTMRFKFSVDSIEDVTVKFYTDSNPTGWVVGADELVETTGGYYVYFDGLKARQMRESVYITVYRGDTAISNTVRYSIESYAYAKRNDSNAKLTALLEAMMKYGDSAYRYINE